MKRNMAILAVGVVFIALAMTSCSDLIAEEEGPTVTLYFGGNPTSRAGAPYPYTPGDGNFHNSITYEIKFYLEETLTSQREPTASGTVKGGGSITIDLPSTGEYCVFVNATWNGYTYASIDPEVAPDGYLLEEITGSTTLKVPMKVETPVFYDSSELGDALATYLGTDPVVLLLAVDNLASYWDAIITAISTSHITSLDLTHCAITAFNPGQTTNGNGNITHITLPSGVSSVGDNAFYGFSGLSSVNLDSVRSIGNNAFEGCASLTTLSIPNVGHIGDYAFQGSGIETLYLGSTAPTLGTGIFSGVPGGNKTVNIYIPTGTPIDGSTGYDFSNLGGLPVSGNMATGNSSTWLLSLFGGPAMFLYSLDYY